VCQAVRALRLEHHAGAGNARGIGRAEQGIDTTVSVRTNPSPLPGAWKPQREMSMTIPFARDVLVAM
jgi:hypothetical protein